MRAYTAAGACIVGRASTRASTGGGLHWACMHASSTKRCSRACTCTRHVAHTFVQCRQTPSHTHMCRKGILYLYTYSYGMKSKSCGENTKPRSLRISTNKDYTIRIVTKMNAPGACALPLLPSMRACSRVCYSEQHWSVSSSHFMRCRDTHQCGHVQGGCHAFVPLGLFLCARV